jgi:hypothetical protein
MAEGYVQSAINAGLREEFAVKVGLHPEDKDQWGDEASARSWYERNAPEDVVGEQVVGNLWLLINLWRQKGEGEEGV